MSNKWLFAFSAAAWIALAAQDMPLEQGSVQVNLPADAPLSLVGIDLGSSRRVSRGAAVELDLNMSLALRNVSQDTICGVTLLVTAHEVTPGGMGSVLWPSLNVAPGQVFTRTISTQLLRPGRNTGGQLVQVNLDGVLFKSLAFYGNNRKDSRRALTAYEIEARRDRQYFKKVLASAGPEGLRKDVLASLTRQAQVPSLNVRVTTGPAVSSAVASASEHPAQFAFLQFPDSPVEPLHGTVQVSGNQARSPDIEILNRSKKPVRYVELGWIVRDPAGADYMVASLPASGPNLNLPVGRSTHIGQNSLLRFTREASQPVAIAGVTAFVSQVQYGDGTIWVPDREELAQHQTLLRALAPSSEEQRLTVLYRTQGLKALIDELNKF
jgi:hypothetical protein